MEERELLILGQQEHEQLLDEEITQLKGLLQEKERQLQHAHALLKGGGRPHQQQHQARGDMDIVERLETLEQEIGMLKRRTPTLAELKCVASAQHAESFSRVTLSQRRERVGARVAPGQYGRCSGGGGSSSTDTRVRALLQFTSGTSH